MRVRGREGEKGGGWERRTDTNRNRKYKRREMEEAGKREGEENKN